MRNIFYQILYTVFNLCFLRASPAQLPYSPLFLALLLPLNGLITVLTFREHAFFKIAPLTQIIITVFLSLLMLMVGIHFVLAQKKLQSRWVQVSIAWFATELMLFCILKNVLWIFPVTQAASQEFLGLLIVMWHMATKVNIIRQANELTVAGAILTTLGILLVSSLPVPVFLGEYLPRT